MGPNYAGQILRRPHFRGLLTGPKFYYVKYVHPILCDKWCGPNLMCQMGQTLRNNHVDQILGDSWGRPISMCQIMWTNFKKWNIVVQILEASLCWPNAVQILCIPWYGPNSMASNQVAQILWAQWCGPNSLGSIVSPKFHGFNSMGKIMWPKVYEFTNVAQNLWI